MKINKSFRLDIRVAAFLLFLLLTFSVTACGIMADVYFKEPTSLSVVSSDPQAVELTFTAENQEKAPNDDFLLAGYDVYYYFDSESNKKKAMVRYPKVPDNTLLITTLVNSDATVPGGVVRFPASGGFSNDTIFQDITIPVTNSMIDLRLGSGNSSNVKIYFDNRITAQVPKDTSIAVEIDEIYPNYTLYYSKTKDMWGDFKQETIDIVDDFAGFYDKDFYDNVVPTSAKVSGTTDKYKVNFFVIAKGFNSNETRNKTLFIESIRSNTVTVTFQIKSGT